MRRISPALIALVLGLLASTVSAQITEAEQAFYEAFYFETGMRNYKDALERYRKAAELAVDSKNEKLILKSMLGRGRCAHALGEYEAAKLAYERALQLDPENAEARQGLQQRPPPQDPALSSDIRRLIVKLTGSERDQAANDLAVIGTRALPYLEEGLRDTAVAVVTGCARALARLKSDEATNAIVKALQQRNLPLPEAIVEAVRNRRMRDADHLAIIKVAMIHPSERVRRLAPKLVWAYKNRFKGELAWPQWQPVLESLVSSSLGGVRIELLKQAWNWPRQAFPRILEKAALDLNAADPRHQLAACRAITQIFFKLKSDGNEEISRSHLSPTAKTLAGLIQHPDRYISVSACNMLRDMPRPHAKAPSAVIMDALRNLVSRVNRDVTLLPLAELVRNRQNQLLLPAENLAELFAVANPSGDPTGHAGPFVHRLRENLAQSIFGVGDSEETRRLAQETWKRIGDDDGRSIWLMYVDNFDIKVASLFAEAARSADESVRLNAYSALMGAKDQFTAPPALPHLADDMLDWKSRVGALARETARHFPSARWLPALEGALAQEQSAQAKRSLIRAIAYQDPQRSLPILRRILRGDPDDRARTAALAELIRLERDRAVPDMLAVLQGGLSVGEVMKAYAAANRAWKSQDPLLSGEARLAIARGVPPDKREGNYIGSVLSKLPLEQRRPFLEEALQNQKPDVRLSAVLACAEASLSDYARKILDLTQDSDQAVRQAAMKALEQYRFSLEMKRLLVDGGDQKALQAALRSSRSKDATKRVGAAYALGALGGSPAVTRLLEMQDDPEQSVQEAALSALERLGGNPKK